MAQETYSAQQVDQLLRCPVCLDKYKEPKILPCQHTFCKSPCLEGVVDMRTRIIKCPECRMEHFVPIDGAAGFPTNITLINFLDLQAQPAAQLAIAAGPGAGGDSSGVGSTSKCGVCQKDSQTIKCAHCNKFACASCKKSHLTQLKFDIGRVVNQIRRGIPKLSNSIAGVEQKSEQVKQHVEGIKSEVRNTIERYIKEIKDRQMLLNSELETFQQSELRNLRLHQENLEVELASISSYCDSTEGSLNESGDGISDTDLMNLKRQCAEYMDQINQSESGDIPGAKQVRFAFEGQSLQNCISNFGELMVNMPGSLSGGGRRNSDSSINDRDRRLARRQWSEAQPIDSVFLTSADIDSLAIDSPRTVAIPSNHMAQPSPPVPALRNRLNSDSNQALSQNSVYTAEASPSDFASTLPTRTRGQWNRSSLPDSLHTPWRPPNRTGRTRDALNSGYMFHMNSPTSAALREELERIREMELLAGSHAQLELTRQLDHSMARQNRQRNQNSNVASIFGQSPRNWPQTNRTQRRGNNRNGGPSPRQSNVRRGRSLDERPAGVSGGVPPPPSTPPRNLEPIPSAGDSIDDSPRNTSNRTNNNNIGANVNRTTAAQRVQNQTTPVVRRVAPPPPGISFEVPLNTPEPESAPTNSQNEVGSITYRAGNSQANVSPGTVNTNNPQPSTSTQSSNLPQPGPLRRRGTFTRDNENQSANSQSSAENIQRPVVNDESVSFDVPLDGVSANDDEESILTFRLSTSDSLTTMRPLNNYQIKGTPSRVIGNGRGNESGKFSSPRGVAVSPINDSIVVADSSNHRVQIFDVNGVFVSSFGSYGHEPGELDCVSGIAVNTMGQIIVADRYNNRIQVFDRYGEFQDCFGTEGDGQGQLKQPWGLACDLSGYIFVCDKGNNRIQVFTQDGTYVRQFGRNQLSSPNYIAVSEDNKVVVSDTNNNRIKIFDAQGHSVSTFGTVGTGSHNFKGPKGVAIDRQGFISVVDAGNSRVKVFRGDGRFFCAFGKPGARRGHLKGSEGLGLTSNGKLVVTDRENNRVQVF